ncbi:MAG: response regulator [Spirochaetales bacterium]|nr:response regulator [Spirochaetales bacterium]
MDKKFKVLVVDDSAVMRKGIIEILDPHITADFLEAGNGNDAIDTFKIEKPDLVTLDINMPLCDGMKALKAIIDMDKNAKVVMLTTESEKEKIVEAVSLGARNYIVKPIDKEKAIEKIKNVLEI